MGQDYNLLDFLAEGFLQRGASVTYKEIAGTAALVVSTEGSPSLIYITSETEVSKMSFLAQHASEEIFIPVLRTEEEIKLKAVLAKAGITGIEVCRLSLPERYAWYSRLVMSKA